MTMKTVLLSIGGQSLLVAFCIHNSYGSWTELQTSLAIIGCSCLFFCALLHFMVIPSDSGSDSKTPRITSHDALQSTKMNTATRVNQTRFTSPPHMKPEEEMSPTANTNYSIPANQSLNLSMESFDGILSSMSPLPSLGLSPTKSPKTPKSPNSSSNLKRTIRSPTASMCKPVLSTSSNQELQPLLQIEAMRGSRTDMNTMNTVNNKRTGKRTDYLDWTDYFLSVAMLSAMRSKDPSTQVGACIVNEEKRIVGIGYNGFPRGCSDEELPWNRKSDKGENDTKYPYVCHAEMNAIMNKNSATCKDCTMYVVLFPCNDCAKLIIQSGIRRIIYICDKYAKTNSVIASKRLFNMAGVQYTQYVPKTKSVLINFPLPDQ